MSLNKLLLIGNVGRKDVKQIQSGKMATFTVATTKRFKDRSGNTREETTWHDVVAYGALADVVEEHVNKGSKVYVEGELRKSSYTDKEGNKKERVECLLGAIQLLDPKPMAVADNGYKENGLPF